MQLLIKLPVLLAALAGPLLLSGAGRAASEEYVIKPLVMLGEKVAGRTLTGFCSRVDINNRGEVAFAAEFRDGRGIFTQDRVIAVIGDTIDGRTLTSTACGPSINNSGEVAFSAGFDGGHGIFTSDEALVVTGNVIGGKTLSVIIFPSEINDGGEVAFHGTFSGGKGIFTQDRAVFISGERIAGQTVGGPQWPSINDRGEVAFVAGIVGGGGLGIFRETSLLVVSGDKISGKTVFFYGSKLSLNNFGEVAFTATYSDTGDYFDRQKGIFRQLGVVAVEQDYIDGKVLNEFVMFSHFGPDISNKGEVAYRAYFLGGVGIFTENGAVAGTGDTVGGKALLHFFSPSINDLGQVAFQATFPGGEGIFLASPDSNGNGIADRYEN